MLLVNKICIGVTLKSGLKVTEGHSKAWVFLFAFRSNGRIFCRFDTIHERNMTMAQAALMHA